MIKVYDVILNSEAVSCFHRWALILVFLILLPWISIAEAGVFEFVSDDDEVDIITHPTGYTGIGGELIVTVGIAPLSPHADEMVIPVKNAIQTWNQLVPTTGNIKIDGNTVPRRMFDFESVALHELGHCIGLGHPNLGTESGLTGEEKDYTKAVSGDNDRFDLDRGMDGIIGSEDDLRGDDINLHWFNKENNNPFLLAEVVDKTTYSVVLEDLPPGHRFVANGDRFVSLLLGYGNTESVMQQGILSGEARRSLVADDVATLRLGMSGLDRLAGTSDDYTLTLQYAGMTDDADIVLNFDNKTVFAACSITGVFINDKHVAIQKGQISFNTGYQWFFNSVSDPTMPEQPVLSVRVNGQAESATLQNGDRLLLTIGLNPGTRSGNQTDYWVLAMTPLGDYWLDSRLQFVRSDTPVRAHGGTMIAFSDLKIFDGVTGNLPAGSYTIIFAVDDNRDQIFDETYQHSVSFTILPR
ncbi:hypothetical protein [Nitrosomonas marina]|uniref:Matrixin n=1 Tax=Nitrosomonas marina TaxID=917 RepID=A0A1H8BSF8_9PROT|nr:hypothetical protein [Nitrosomonas marina]SEM85795.1 hypothetical protein SAMN05216325_10385 [Nitrosomonas marina]